MNERYLEQKKISIEVKEVNKSFKVYNRKIDKIKELLGGRNNHVKRKQILSNITFEVRRGESLGIIGKNGSGKSTLLQLICGTMVPTSGEINTFGKIGALLELGSGFSPEFTGLENVKLNARLMGLDEKQINNKLDKILSFADIGQSIKEPVRTYSSGMIVRLAFAIIANIDADILVIDEALAVGDAFFVQKCMRFINQFRENNTLIFVSHDPTAVTAVCERALLLERGTVAIDGNSRTIIEHYTKNLQEQMSTNIENTNKGFNGVLTEDDEWQGQGMKEYEMKWQDYRAEALKNSQEGGKYKITKCATSGENLKEFGSRDAEIKIVEINNVEKERNIGAIEGGEIVSLRIEIETNKEIKDAIVGFIIKDDKGQIIIGDNTSNKLNTLKQYSLESKKKYYAEFIFTLPLLRKGNYSISVSVAEGNNNEHRILHWINDAIMIESICDDIAAGIAGVMMQSIKFGGIG